MDCTIISMCLLCFYIRITMIHVYSFIDEKLVFPTLFTNVKEMLRVQIEADVFNFNNGI